MVGYEDPTFFIKSGDLGFADRQKNIFDLLNVAEKQKNERQNKSDVEMSEGESKSTDNIIVSRKRSRSQMKQFRGKESIFKKPDLPPPRLRNKNNTPDHQRNPHKWIKYSLADVSQDDMSDQSNTAAALSFLKEMKERKGGIKMEVDILPSEITFKQPRNKSKLLIRHDPSVSIVAENTDNVEDEKPSFRSSKLIMPEYVVGMTKKKGKNKSHNPNHLIKNESVSSRVKLSHLAEEDD